MTTDITILPGHFETGVAGRRRVRTAGRQVSRQAFFGVLALLFFASATVTVLWCNSMSAMGEMPMPGGWTMSMAWMRMPRQTWAGATASFVAMWVVMMAAMMLPSLTPTLWRYYRCIEETCRASRGGIVMVIGLGYFFVWTLFGVAVFPAGTAIATAEMEWPALARAVPLAAGVIVLLAGVSQFTAWKTRHLVGCRVAPGNDCVLPARSAAAWRQGVGLGLHCGLSCANLTAILLVVGVMDLRAMAAVTVAITAERLAPAGQAVSRAVGWVAIGAGLLLIAGVVRLG